MCRRRGAEAAAQVLTGCMLHNVEARWQLVRGLEASLPGGGEGREAPPLPPVPAPPLAALAEASPEVAAYAAALQTRLDAAEAALATAAASAASASASSPPPPPPPGTNALLSHLRALQSSQVAALSPAGSTELSGACSALVDSLLGRLPPSRGGAAARKPLPPALPGLADDDDEDVRPLADLTATLSFTRDYASDLLLWCMGAGHFARAQDHLCRLERAVLGPAARDDAPLRPFLDGSSGAAGPSAPHADAP